MVTEGVEAAQGSHQSCMLLTLELTLIHPTHILQGYIHFLHHNNNYCSIGRLFTYLCTAKSLLVHIRECWCDEHWHGSD